MSSGSFLIFASLLFTIFVDCEEIFYSQTPVILVPGYGGSILNAKFKKTYKTSWNCSKEGDGYRIFMDSTEISQDSSCWVYNILLKYDNKTKRTRNQDGVFINVPFWGETKSVESIDIQDTDIGKFFTSITESLVNRLDYRRDVSIRAAPYDFRKGPDEHGEFFIKLRKLVEDTYRQNNNTPVIFIAYSLGGRMTLIFLQRQTQVWKQKYIKSLITLGTPWFGSMLAIKILLEGNRSGPLMIDPLRIRTMVRTFPSAAFLVPSGPVWKDLVTMPFEAYNQENMTRFFKEIGLPQISDFLTNMKTYRENFNAPGVEVHCLHGKGFFKVNRFRFKSHIHPDAKYEKALGDGDGTVNIQSLKGCELWKNTQTEKVTVKSFPGIKHRSMLHSGVVLQHIIDILVGG